MISPKRARSIYSLTPREAAKGIASRIVYSQYYIFLYLVLAALSTTTVVLSVAEGCPGLAFYILEIIVNSAMIAEVSIRYIAFGKVSIQCGFHLALPHHNPSAILEIAIQCSRPGSYVSLRHNYSHHILFGMWLV